MKLLDVFGKFRLEVIPASWVNKVWNSNFNGDVTLPNEFTPLFNFNHSEFSDLVVQLTNEIKKCLDPKKSGVSKYKESSSTNWNYLVKKKVKYKALICILSCFMKDIKEDTISPENISISLKCVRLYINLLSIPDAWSCHIFNSVLFDRAMTILRLGNVISSSGSEETHEDEPLESTSESAKKVIRPFSEDEKKDIMLGFWLLLHDLTICFKHLKLKNEAGSLKSLIKMTVKLTCNEKRCKVFETPVNQLDNVSKIAFKSYSILEQLCSSDHGNTSETADYILQCIFPSLVINAETIRSPASENDTIQRNNFTFIKRLFNVYGATVAHPVLVLAQKLFMEVPDKITIRARVVEQLLNLMHIFNYDLFKSIIIMLVRFTQSQLVKQRICAIELIAKLLTNLNEGIVLSNDPSFDNITPVEKFQFYKFLFGIMFSNSVDVSAAIRYKCLCTIADLMLSNNADISQIMRKVFNPAMHFRINKEFFNIIPYLESQPKENFIYPDDPLPSGCYFLRHARIFTKDNKVFVRKGALHVIANLFSFHEAWITADAVKILVDRCTDCSIMIKQFVNQSLTELILKYPCNDNIITGWVLSVVPAVNDIDVETRERAIEHMKRVILDNISYYHNLSNRPIHQLPWRVINLIANYHKKQCLTTAFSTWSTQNVIRATLIDEIKSHIGCPYNPVVWFLIVSISEVLTIPNPEFIYDYFYRHTDISSSSNDHVSLLVVHALEFNRSRLSTDIQVTLNNNLKMCIENFSVRIPFIGPFFDLCYLYNNDETKAWCTTVLETCELFLKTLIAPGCTRKIEQSMLSRYILTLGEANNFQPGVSPNIISYLANIIDPKFREPGDPPRWIGPVADEVKAVAVLTLGRICIQSSITTQKYAIVFANTLANPREFLSTRNNSMAALSDLYVRYPFDVGVYLPKMFVSIKDGDPELRKNSLRLILRLIKEDTIQLHNPLFFYLLTMLLDNSLGINELVNDFIEKTILQKNKNIMCQSFVQAAFFFSGFFETYEITIEEKRVFSLSGANNFSGRALIYKYMLNHMPDDDKCTTMNRLCLEILEQVNENKIILDLRGTAVLKDALYCMSCDEMRLELVRGLFEDDSRKEPSDTDAMKNLTEKILIKYLVKKNYIGQVIPTMIKLRAKLILLNSSLIRCFMECMKQMMKPYKNELKDLLAADPQLATELEKVLGESRVHRALHDEFVNLGLEGYGEVDEGFKIFQSMILHAHRDLLGAPNL